MSTNFYAHINLGGPVVELHIGKSSIGWCFALHVTDEITSLDDWRKVWAQAFVTIVDEYGSRCEPDDMLKIVNARGGWTLNEQTGDWYDLNHATRGPHGLARHTYNATLPPNPEADTYDLCSGDFS